jgi:hypothetical protein
LVPHRRGKCGYDSTISEAVRGSIEGILKDFPVSSGGGVYGVAYNIISTVRSGKAPTGTNQGPGLEC